jgi:energy-coupling factor transporter transmembrane protein EcfT
VIQLSYLDYSAVEGKSRLHRCSATVKIIGMALVLFGIVALRNIPGLLLLYAILVGLFFLSSSFPDFKPISFSFSSSRSFADPQGLFCF